MAFSATIKCRIFIQTLFHSLGPTYLRTAAKHRDYQAGWNSGKKAVSTIVHQVEARTRAGKILCETIGVRKPFNPINWIQGGFYQLLCPLKTYKSCGCTLSPFSLNSMR